MNHSQACVDLVAQFEGVRLEAYQDQRGIWTIGYGHTYSAEPGKTCTIEQAKNWLFTDLMIADQAVNKSVAISVNQNEFDAMVSLAFNIGGSAFEHSTLVDMLNKHDIMGAANQFLVWCKTNGQTNAGLVRRRTAERKLFLSPQLVA